MVTLLNWAQVFKWCMAGLVVKTSHIKTCNNEIGLFAQNTNTIVGTVIVNRNGKVAYVMAQGEREPSC